MSESETRVEVKLEHIYLKDASFESPASPQVFGEAWQPDLQVDINTRANALGEGRHEVVLTVTIRAKRDNGKTAFVVEVQQAGVFQFEGLNEQMLRQALAVFCPGTLFPYLRESVDTLVVKGGFPALRMAPVNFEALYAQALKAQEAQQPAPEGDQTQH